MDVIKRLLLSANLLNYLIQGIFSDSTCRYSGPASFFQVKKKYYL